MLQLRCADFVGHFVVHVGRINTTMMIATTQCKASLES